MGMKVNFHALKFLYSKYFLYLCNINKKDKAYQAYDADYNNPIDGLGV